MAIAFASALLAVDDVVKIRGITKDMVEDMTPKRFVELANGTRNLERNNVETRAGLNKHKNRKLKVFHYHK